MVNLNGCCWDCSWDCLPQPWGMIFHSQVSQHQRTCTCKPVAVLRGGGGRRGANAPSQTARLAWSRGGRHAIIYTATARYVDQTFFVTQDREKSTHPVEGAAAQESIDSVEGATTHSVPSSSGRSASTLSGGAAHHKFCACFSPTHPLLLCTPMLQTEE